MGKSKEPQPSRRKGLADYPARLRALIADGTERGDSVRTIAKAAAVSPALVSKVATLMREAGALPPRERSASKTEQATEARRRRRGEKREELSTLLLEKLSHTAAAHLLGRLEEEDELEALVAEARRRLDEAVLGLEALHSEDDPRDPATAEEKAAKAELRKEARARVQDARLALVAYRESRIPVRTLVGILTRAINDHLALEGEAVSVPVPVIIEFGAPLPDEQAPRIYSEAELRGEVLQ